MSLPFSYNMDTIYLFPVDPNCLYTYWDYAEATWNKLEENDARVMLCLMVEDYELQKIEVNRKIRNYYFKGLKSRTKYKLLLQIVANGEVTPFMETPIIETPPDTPSENTDAVFKKFKFIEPKPKAFFPDKKKRYYPEFYEQAQSGKSGKTDEYDVQKTDGQAGDIGGVLDLRPEDREKAEQAKKELWWMKYPMKQELLSSLNYSTLNRLEEEIARKENTDD